MAETGRDAEEIAALLALDPVPPDATLRYGEDHPDQVVDLYGTRPGEGPPVRVVALHGGFWRAAHDRAHLSPAAAALAAAGLPVALVEYRRVGAGGGWPVTGEDVCAALDALDGLEAPPAADPIGADDGGSVLLGHSAGGHLALWAACRALAPERERRRERGGPVAGARGVVAVAPVADLADAVRTGLGDGAATALLGAGPGGAPDPALLADADPAAHPPPAVPVVSVHGTEDGQVPFDRSERWRARRPADRLVPLPGTGHYAPITPGTPAFARLLDTVGELLGTAPGE
ncbi:alpha/beta hydrolase fold domain-containing protein [Streptomyces calidiresistens]|uniref:Alpha/beta hydrolase fold domain-containing protein n=1 Tax=Streptomyces calidiresistens TaxID=1485586 RepID=A0A7W3XY11_9ACTN|nr:alpha/beta hydrolase fold domain-containing protein [Streptomyces calidiresistens]MBB0231336.1 alpha/beta hydrolase fold domain-containing protein [Streptomyces calidiresistens]